MKFKMPHPLPEATASKKLFKYMRVREWHLWKLGGGKFTIGWPDFYAFHHRYGKRWIEMKAPGGKLRASQRKKFSEFQKAGDRVFVLEGPEDYYKLFKPKDNWEQYL